MIIGICNGSRASARMRIGHGLSHHNRHMLMLPGNTARNNAAAANAAKRLVCSGSKQGADDELSDSGRVGVEPRRAGQFDGDDVVERLRRHEVEGANAKQHRRDSVGRLLAGIPLGTMCDGGHGYIVSCVRSSR